MATLGHTARSSLPLSGGAGPLYQRIKNWVRERIGAGEWPVHHKLPSEHQLVEQLRVSRMTVHRALKELTEDHTLVRVPGVGTFVAPGKGHQAFLQIEDVKDEIESRGNTHSCNVIVLRKEKAADRGALFGIRPGASLFHSQVVHYENGVPVMVEDKHVRPELVPRFLEQDFTRSSTSRYLRSAVLATEAEQCIEAIDPSKTIRSLLGLDTGPCLLLSRRVWVHEQVAIHSQRVYPGSPYRLGSRFKKSNDELSEIR